MRHVVSINLAEVGYATLAGDPSKGFAAQPIGIATSEVSEAILAAFSHLDDELRRRASGTAVRFEHPSAGTPYVCLGASFPHAKDQFGRQGLSFLHALECDDIAQLPHAALAVLQALSTVDLDRLAQEIARVAIERDESHAFLTSWCDAMEGRVRRSPLPEQPTRLKVVGTVEHDVTGARSIANLALVLGRIGQPAGWCVLERFEEGRIVSVVEPPVDGIDRASVLLASALTTLSQVEAPADSAATRPTNMENKPPVPPEPTPTLVNVTPAEVTLVDVQKTPPARPTTQPRRASVAPTAPVRAPRGTARPGRSGAGIAVVAALLGLALGVALSVGVVRRMDAPTALPAPSVALPLQPTPLSGSTNSPPVANPVAPVTPRPSTAPVPPGPFAPADLPRPVEVPQAVRHAPVNPVRRVAPLRRVGGGGRGARFDPMAVE